MALLAQTFGSEVSSHVLFINSDQKSELLDLENKLDRFWNLKSIVILGNEKHSQEHFIESIYLDEKIANVFACLCAYLLARLCAHVLGK